MESSGKTCFWPVGSLTQNWFYFSAETLHPCFSPFPLLLSASPITSPASPITLVWSAIGFEFIRTCQSDCGKRQLCCVDTRGAGGQPLCGHGAHWLPSALYCTLGTSVRDSLNGVECCIRSLWLLNWSRNYPHHIEDHKFYCQYLLYSGLWRRITYQELVNLILTPWKPQILFTNVRQCALFWARWIP